jgi:two-component system sensor histidine kinase KdpD
MEDDERLSPDEYLKIAQFEEEKTKQGQLKIFLGMAAGVGKTYSMLVEAGELKKSGVNVVVGVIETHHRKDTEALLKDIPVVPQKQILYKEKEFSEFDVDAIIQLKPDAVLVDELAHTNIPGAKHSKRWQDVIELLEHGINVYTTLNVQHIESLNDVVKGITDVSVRETVPDHVVERASSIRIVDITPEELLLRLKQGKVYLGDQSLLAIKNFFQKERLTALRELILRYGADKVDRDLRLMKSQDKISDWKTKEKILVVVTPELSSQAIIRKAYKFASSLDASWVAAYINTGASLGKDEEDQLSKNLALANSLGAEIITVNDSNRFDGIKRLAKQKNATQIILENERATSFWDVLKSKSFADKITIENKDIDFHIVQKKQVAKSPIKKSYWNFITSNFTEYLWVLFLIIGVAYLCKFFLPYIGYHFIGAIFLLCILLVSLFFKKGPILFSALLSALVWDYYFIPPFGLFRFTSRQDFALLVSFILTGMINGVLVSRARENKKILIQSETTSHLLYEIARQMAIASSEEKIFDTVKYHLESFLRGTVSIVVRKPEGGLDIDAPSLFNLQSEKERKGAEWSFENGKEAGWSTNTLSSLKNLFIPLRGFYEVVGVLAYEPLSRKKLTPDQLSSLYAICQLLSIYIEKLFKEQGDKGKKDFNVMETVYKGIIKKITQEINDPLFILNRSILELKNYHRMSLMKLGGMTQVDAIEKATLELDQMLKNLNILERSIEGVIVAKKEVIKVFQLLEMVIKKTQKEVVNHIIQFSISNKNMIIFGDYNLLETLFANLIIVSAKNSPKKSVIQVRADENSDAVFISIEDKGEHLTEEQLKLIDEKKYFDTALNRFTFFNIVSDEVAKIHNGYFQYENLKTQGVKTTIFIPKTKHDL